MSEAFTFEDFRIEDNKLRLAKRGFVAVVILSRDPDSLELVKNLATLNVPHLHTGYLDITQGANRKVVVMAKNTTTPIQSVPYLGFFVDGKLKCRYKGDTNRSTLFEYFQDKILESAQQSASSSTIRKNETRGSVGAKNFAMAENNDKANRGGKNIPSVKDTGVIPYNMPWRGDK